MLTALLIVTVWSAGGPVHARPVVLRDAVVSVRQRAECASECIPPGPRLIATSKTGRLEVHLRPGRYQITASLVAPDVNEERTCAAEGVKLKRGHTIRINMHCSVV